MPSLLIFVVLSIPLLSCDKSKNFATVYQTGKTIQSSIGRNIKYAAFSDEVRQMAIDISCMTDNSAKGKALQTAYQSALEVMQDTVKLWDPKRTDYVPNNTDEIQLESYEWYNLYRDSSSMWRIIDQYNLKTKLVRTGFGGGIYNLPVKEAVQKLLSISATRLETANKMYVEIFKVRTARLFPPV